ncbi:MAG: DNA mismatch repair endonuclease MutL [Candidatus Gracilibacteria bacterium]|nr:DNA mismatch repair endonuclease MutL [Candidatus Gracilibacteria bacterium]
MSKIIKLDKTLANQIAAGEVVERPVSVVKELVENSIDAGATSIKVEIKGGGIDEIIITDNGTGIEKEDLSLAIEKYSTSKIKSLQDLYNVMTFGFRGEALASISSVSKFQIISKKSHSPHSVSTSLQLQDSRASTPSFTCPKGREEATIIDSGGYSLEVVDGEKTDIVSYPCETGTKIIVKNLFYNTPARLNYLKKQRTEYAHILEFLNAMSLVYPQIGFEFVSDEKSVFKYPEKQDLKTRIYNIYGEEFSDNLLEVNVELVGVKISGYISDPKVSFPNKNRQSLFVNKRVIKSPLIFKSISDAYNRFIPHGSFPAYVLNIDVDPTQVDVNVHPRKLEVRFANESQIFRGVYHAVEDKLNSVSLVSSSQQINPLSQPFPSREKGVEQCSNVAILSPLGGKLDRGTYYTGSGTKFKSYSPYKDTSANPAQANISDAINFSKGILDNSKPGVDLERNERDLHDTPLGRIIGQAHNSYIIVETKDGIKFLDQHALAERIIYEKLINSKTGFKTQGLLIGESLNLSPKELNILEENKNIFEEMGFDFEIMGGAIIMINGIPDFVKKENIKNIFLGVLDDIGEHEFTKSKTLQEIKNKIYAYTACRSAIKFGNKLNLFEMNKLLCDSVGDYSSTCPHGRPVVFDINLEELKNRYER